MRCAILPVTCKGTTRRSTYTKAWLERLAAAVDAYYRTQSGGRIALPCTVYDWQEIDLTPQQWLDAGFYAGRRVYESMAADGRFSTSSYDHYVVLIDDAISSGGVTPNEAPETSLIAAFGVTPALVAHELGHRLQASHTFLDSKDGPIEYGGPYCIMGDGSYAFIDEALIAPAEGSDYSNARTGPGMCFANLVRTGWADPVVHTTRVKPFANGTFGTVVQIAALNGAPPANQPGIPVACIVEDDDWYIIEYRSPTTFYDSEVPYNAAPHRGDIVVYRSPAGAASFPLQVGTAEAAAGTIMILGDPTLAAMLEQKTGARPALLKLVVLSVGPDGRTLSMRIEKGVGRPPQYFRTDDIFDFMQWAIARRQPDPTGDRVLPLLKALAEFHDLSRLRRVSSPRDRAALGNALKQRRGELERLVRELPDT